MSKGVRCIRIDSKNRTIEEVYRVIPSEGIFRDESFGQTHSTPLRIDKTRRSKMKEAKSLVMLHYFHPDRYKAEASVEWGYVFDERLNLESDDDDARLNDAVGEGLIVEYLADPDKAYVERDAIDCTMTLEEAKKRVTEWTSGILKKVPEFTCILSESFDSPGKYELKLRCESWSMLFDEFMAEAVIIHHTSRMMSVKINDVEILVVSGAISDLSQNVRVVVHRSDGPSLHTIGAVTLRAEKIPQWVKRSLEGYFKKIWVDDVRETAQELRASKSQHKLSLVETEV